MMAIPGPCDPIVECGLHEEGCFRCGFCGAATVYHRLGEDEELYVCTKNSQHAALMDDAADTWPWDRRFW
jgi:hypothetical protein